jgi:hypothetical protein
MADPAEASVEVRQELQKLANSSSQTIHAKTFALTGFPDIP